MGSKQAKAKQLWIRVTNEFIVKRYRQPECTNCEGHGLVGDDTNGYKTCGCCILAFRREADSLTLQGKLRLRKQRMGVKDVEWFEYRNLGSVDAAPELTDNDNQREHPISNEH